MVHGIIPLTENSNIRPPIGASVSDVESSVDSLLGQTPIESLGYFVSGDADYDPSNSPYPASNIPSPSQPSPPNTSQ